MAFSQVRAQASFRLLLASVKGAKDMTCSAFLGSSDVQLGIYPKWHSLFHLAIENHFL